MGQFSCGTVFRGTICARGNYVGDKLSTQFPVGYCPGAIIFEVIVWEQLSRGNHSGAIIQWGNFLCGKSSPVAIVRGLIVPGQLSEGQFSLEAIILGGNFPRGQLSKYQLPRMTYLYLGAYFFQNNVKIYWNPLQSKSVTRHYLN